MSRRVQFRFVVAKQILPGDGPNPAQRVLGHVFHFLDARERALYQVKLGSPAAVFADEQASPGGNPNAVAGIDKHA